MTTDSVTRATRSRTRSITVDGERWPVVDGIPWLRAGREDLRERVLAALDAGDDDAATVLLLADADDWWDEPPPPPEQIAAALRATTMRSAVQLLGLGRVGDYLLHRWSDPTWLAVLALTAAHPPGGRPVLDLACGAGHLLRHLALHGQRDLLGVDVVFAKLWLARRFVVRDLPVRLVCADLTRPWPLRPPDHGAYVTCHDALYFLEGKRAFVDQAVRYAGEGGAVVLGHCHRAGHPSSGTGHPLTPAQWRGLLPGAVAYAEEELTAATLDGRLPLPADERDLALTEAIGLARDHGDAAAQPLLTRPTASSRLRLNPLYRDRVRTWPGAAWTTEYASRARAYLPDQQPLTSDRARAVRRRWLVDLPEQW